MRGTPREFQPRERSLRHRRHIVGARAVWPILACGLAAAGCAHGGGIQIVELNFKRIPDREPLADAIVPMEGYWWIDDQRVCIAVRDVRAAALGDLHRREFEFSLVLEGLPAETARDYQVGPQTLRGYRRIGPNHARFASTQGIVGAWFEPGNVLRGRFRLIAVKEVFHVLTGWSRVGQVLMYGEFQAVQDERRGRPILARSEEGMNRTRETNTPMPGRPRPVRVDGPPIRVKNSVSPEEPGNAEKVDK